MKNKELQMLFNIDINNQYRIAKEDKDNRKIDTWKDGLDVLIHEGTLAGDNEEQIYDKFNKCAANVFKTLIAKEIIDFDSVGVQLLDKEMFSNMKIGLLKKANVFSSNNNAEVKIIEEYDVNSDIITTIDKILNVIENHRRNHE